MNRSGYIRFAANPDACDTTLLFYKIIKPTVTKPTKFIQYLLDSRPTLVILCISIFMSMNEFKKFKIHLIQKLNPCFF